MDKDKILDYVRKTPANTNPNVLKTMLDSDSGGGNVFQFVIHNDSENQQVTYISRLDVEYISVNQPIAVMVGDDSFDVFYLAKNYLGELIYSSPSDRINNIFSKDYVLLNSRRYTYNSTTDRYEHLDDGLS